MTHVSCRTGKGGADRFATPLNPVDSRTVCCLADELACKFFSAKTAYLVACIWSIQAPGAAPGAGQYTASPPIAERLFYRHWICESWVWMSDIPSWRKPHSFCVARRNARFPWKWGGRDEIWPDDIRHLLEWLSKENMVYAVHPRKLTAGYPQKMVFQKRWRLGLKI